ncbi:Tn3 transposase DDE domain-containing protein [Actinoplanes xinjiangensis]|uniref:Tn3 transposase DDE domain-containing protein n=1 Tax=Actinoplanes xinjiangensis TaxID=512350 RepID=A0A316FPI3_9ACTN|nr:Tn3 transposase DDE domain-containing protein [Actinoplanes xinjiangensis]GIF42538.1 hypothetical protein Axi01nite_68490 [Actinoplanes xinjiangensis]
MQPYLAGQEDQLGAVGLMLNAVVLWNTRYIDLAVNVLRGQGYPVRDEDAAAMGVGSEPWSSTCRVTRPPASTSKENRMASLPRSTASTSPVGLPL